MFAQNRRYIALLIVAVFSLTACQREPIPPTIIRMTATPRPVTDTAVPPTPTSASQQETPAPEETPAGPADTPTLAPTETPAGETVRFQWVRPLSTIEELEPILANVEEFEGVILAAGSEVHVDVTFDPTVTSVEELIAQFQQIGRPVELAEE